MIAEMLSNHGSMQALLSVGRAATRVVLNGCHQHTRSSYGCDSIASSCSSSPVQGSSTRGRFSAVRHQLRCHMTVACSSAAEPPETSTEGITRNDSSRVALRAKFISVCCGFPKDMLFGPSTVRQGNVFGDDACFLAQHRNAHVVGVADGVGGWRQYGIDPSAFSRSLMRECEQLVQSGQFQPHQPARLLADAYSTLIQIRLSGKDDLNTDDMKEGPLIGSSTACVVMLDPATRQLHAANLGDSGFLVIRQGRVVHRSEEQCHYFNAPFQLALPPNIEQPGARFLSDRPESADTSSFVVQEGDMILLATDGLFDNVPVEMLETQLAKLPRKLSSDIERANALQEQCNAIALMARRLAFDQNFVSPFEEKARAHGIGFRGGKPDDITVVLVMVTSEEQSFV